MSDPKYVGNRLTKEDAKLVNFFDIKSDKLLMISLINSWMF
jgi:hypothetical protein